MAIIQTMMHYVKSWFQLMHWILLASVLAETVDVRKHYIWLALLAFQVLRCQGFLKKAQMVVTSVFRLLFWVLWGFMVTGRHDLGCGYIRLALVALPILRSERALETAGTAAKYIWQLVIWILQSTWYFLRVLACTPWMTLTTVFPMSSILLLVQILIIFMQSAFVIMPWILWLHTLMGGLEVPFLLCEAIVQVVKTVLNHVWVLCSYGKVTSIEDYLDDGHAATMFHDTLHFRICTRDGQNLWKGFIDVVLNAYGNHRSWAGTFESEDLQMSGSNCIIANEANIPANYQNLLLDLAKLASLLIPHFETTNQVAPGYVQELYSSMTAPLLASNPPPTPQQVQRFVRFMQNHPALRSARKTNSFVRKVFESSKGMEQAGSDAVAAAVDKVIMVEADWRNMIMMSGHVLLNRTLFHRAGQQNNPRYGVGPRQVFRFITNFLTHGADRDPNGQQTVNDMEELDLMASEFFCHSITELVYHLIMDIEMTGMLKHAWEEYL